MPAFRSWLPGFSEVDFALITGASLAALILLVALIILAARVCAMRAAEQKELAHAADYEQLQVMVLAHGQEAELEVSTDAFDSYEELRELVVEAVPSMFTDTDELMLEFRTTDRSKWQRVKRTTPLSTLKAARAARVVVIEPNRRR